MLIVSDLVQEGGSKVRSLLLRYILAVYNNPLEDFPERFLFCHENNQLKTGELEVNY